MRKLSTITLVALALSSGVWAIPPAIPRQYQPLPVNTNVFFLPYFHSESNTSLDQSLPIVGSPDLSANAIMPTYLRYLNVGCHTAYFWASLLWARITGDVGSPFEPATTKSQTGLGDPILGFSYAVAGEPAMTLMEFAKWKATTTINAALYFSPPLGTYHRDRLLNIGTNRWTVKPELAFSHRNRKLLSEVYANAQVFTDNTDFLNGRTLAQDPIYGIDGHFSYDIRQNAFVSFDVYQRWGGETSVNGVRRNNSQNYTVLGFTLNASPSMQDTFYIMYGAVIDANSGPDFNAIQILYGHFF